MLWRCLRKIVCALLGHAERERFELVRPFNDAYDGGYQTYYDCARCEERL